MDNCLYITRGGTAGFQSLLGKQNGNYELLVQNYVMKWKLSQQLSFYKYICNDMKIENIIFFLLSSRLSHTIAVQSNVITKKTQQQNLQCQAKNYLIFIIKDWCSNLRSRLHWDCIWHQKFKIIWHVFVTPIYYNQIPQSANRAASPCIIPLQGSSLKN